MLYLSINIKCLILNGLQIEKKKFILKFRFLEILHGSYQVKYDKSVRDLRKKKKEFYKNNCMCFG